MNPFFTGNAKQPTILGQMIAEAREIRENQSCRNSAGPAAVIKQNHMESVRTLFHVFKM